MKHMKNFQSYEAWLNEKSKGLWANIRAKRARGEKPARKGSKAYKRAVSAAKDISESAWKSLGLGDPVLLRPGISYEIADLDFIGEIGEAADYIVRSLRLKEGEIYWDKEDFIVSGVTESGNIIYLQQHGEYSMYGGPYHPKMQKPEIKVNGKDFSEEIIKELTLYQEIGNSKYPDISDVEPYGALLNKSPRALQTHFTSKKFGL